MIRVMGIDPGISGAVVVVNSRGDVVGQGRMPVRAGPAGRRRVDAHVLLDLVQALEGDKGLSLVVIENPSAMPKQGVSSSFAFGRSVGVVEGVIASLAVPVELVSPATWKRAMRVPADKHAARARATELMPKDRSLWATASQECIAEAAMLALWGVRLASGNAPAPDQVRGVDLFKGVR